jgi:hypothetical protein
MGTVKQEMEDFLFHPAALGLDSSVSPAGSSIKGSFLGFQLLFLIRDSQELHQDFLRRLTLPA